MARWLGSRSRGSQAGVRVHGEIHVDAALLLSYIADVQRTHARAVTVAELVADAVEYAVTKAPELPVMAVDAGEFDRAFATSSGDVVLVTSGSVAERPAVIAGLVVARPSLVLSVSYPEVMAADVVLMIEAIRAYLSHPAEFAVTAWEPREAPAGT